MVQLNSQFCPRPSILDLWKRLMVAQCKPQIFPMPNLCPKLKDQPTADLLTFALVVAVVVQALMQQQISWKQRHQADHEGKARKQMCALCKEFQ